MKTLLVSVLSLFLFLGDAPTAPAVNSKAITFDLKSSDGKNISLNSFKDSKGIILTFLTNECPYAQVYQNRVKALQEKYGKLGFPVVAIDPSDDIADMRQEAVEKGFNFYYLQDSDKKISWAYGAIVNTHTCILIKEKGGFRIAYIGAIDDNKNEDKVKNKYVESAIESILAKEDIKVKTTIAKGCTINYGK